MATKSKETTRKNQKSNSVDYDRTTFALSSHFNRIQNQIDDEDRYNTTTTTVNGKTTFHKYWLIKSCKSGELKEVSPFIVKKYMKYHYGDQMDIKHLKSGDLLVAVRDATQADKIRRNTQVHDVKTISEPHRSLNTRRGVVRCPDLRGMDDDVLLEEWSDQGVSGVRRIHTYRNGSRQPTDTIIVTFALQHLPKELKAGYLILPVTTYVPQPLRCFQCQRYGHHKAKCTGKVACQVCSEEGHDNRACENKAHCRNCGGDHPPSSKTCKKWLKEKEISKLQAERNISYTEARKLCESEMSSAGRQSYAQVAAGTLVSRPAGSVQTRTQSTQTNFTNESTQTETENKRKNTNTQTTQTEFDEIPTTKPSTSNNSQSKPASTPSKSPKQQQSKPDSASSKKKTLREKPGPKCKKTKISSRQTTQKPAKIVSPTKKSTSNKKRSLSNSDPEEFEMDLQANKYFVLSETEDRATTEEESEAEMEIHHDSGPPSETENDSHRVK